MRRRKHLLLWSSVATLLLLGWAIYEEHFGQEWRRLQQQYQSRLPAGQNFPVQLRQIVVPSLAVTDRCVSCHLGMAAGETPLEGDPVFGAHPPVAHDPAEFGCTVCHGGQGRATSRADAHGDVEFWPLPLLPAPYRYAGCGSCHTHLAVPRLEAVQRGRALVERFDCLRCHALEGRGGTLRPFADGAAPAAPDLSAAGARGLDSGWVGKHGPGALPELAADERSGIDAFLSSRSGAPGLVEAKALFHSLGCRGCHAVSGVGGDDGPDLSQLGRRDPAQLDFSGVRGERSLPNWLREHFRAPARVVPGSAMPEMGLGESEIEGLTFYLLSLRGASYPEAFWPRDRVRAQLLGERDFSSDGATLYGSFCAACHGPRGQGVRYPGSSTFPAVANPDFLALASDEFLTAAIGRGRPGRRMPGWGSSGGLTEAEIANLVGYLRLLGNGAAAEPDPRQTRWVEADRARGKELYVANCASCHGLMGEGGEGTALGNPVLLETATDTYLVQTISRGRRGTNMPSFAEASLTHRALTRSEIESIVAFLRLWETRP